MNTKNPKDVHPQGFNVKGNHSKIHNKDTKIFSFKNPKRQRLYELFLSGERLTTVSATIELKIPDFRSEVRYIKAEGVNIGSYWVKSELSRFKVYFLAPSATVCQSPGGRHEEK